MSNRPMERRCLKSEIRSEPDSNKIVGYAVVFNSLSGDLGGFREVVRPGAFKRTLNNNADVRFLFNHDSNYVLGRNQANTLSLSEDNYGLRIENTPPNTQWANDLRESIKRGDINQMSFGFRVVKDNWGADPEDNTRQLREILEAELFDVSVVTYPAYESTVVSVRDLITNIDSQEKAESFLKEFKSEIEKRENINITEVFSRINPLDAADSNHHEDSQSVENTTDDPPAGWHSENRQSPSVEILKRRLELKMKSV